MLAHWGFVQFWESVDAPDRILFTLYRVLLGLHLFRGFRQGLAEIERAPPLPIPLVAAPLAFETD